MNRLSKLHVSGGFSGFALWLAGAASVVAICGTLYYRDTRQLALRIEDREQGRTGYLSSNLAREFQAAAADARVMASSDGVQQAVQTADQKEFARLAAEFMRRIQELPGYEQICFVDEHGRERVVADRNRGIFRDSALLDRSHDDFFQNAMNRPQGQVWLSPLRLRKEDGKVEALYAWLLPIGGSGL